MVPWGGRGWRGWQRLARGALMCLAGDGGGKGWLRKHWGVALTSDRETLMGSRLTKELWWKGQSQGLAV